jgi:hypothetical protein
MKMKYLPAEEWKQEWHRVSSYTKPSKSAPGIYLDLFADFIYIYIYVHI